VDGLRRLVVMAEEGHRPHPLLAPSDVRGWVASMLAVPERRPRGMAAEGMQFSWRWNGGTISTVLDGIWGMSA